MAEGVEGMAEERDRLDAHIALLVEELTAIHDAALADPPDDEHDIEGSSVGYERARVTHLLATVRQRRAELDAVIADGAQPAACEVCGRPIPEERRAALPGVRRCVGCSVRGGPLGPPGSQG